MNTDKTFSISSASSEATEKLGEKIGRQLKGGEVIELASDLGGGKTTFVRGLANGAGSSDKVASPTFTISKQYSTKDFTIYHYDFYRLQEPGVIEYELQEGIDDPRAVVVVEWADIVHDVLPGKRMTIQIQSEEGSENSRKIIINYPIEMEYLIS